MARVGLISCGSALPNLVGRDFSSIWLSKESRCCLPDLHLVYRNRVCLWKLTRRPPGLVLIVVDAPTDAALFVPLIDLGFAEELLCRFICKRCQNGREMRLASLQTEKLFFGSALARDLRHLLQWVHPVNDRFELSRFNYP